MKQRKAKLRGVSNTDLNETINMFPDLPPWPIPIPAPALTPSTVVILQSLESPAAPIVHDEPPPIAAETSIEIMHRLNWATRDLPRSGNVEIRLNNHQRHWSN
jgi:hypothetical protein